MTVNKEINSFFIFYGYNEEGKRGLELYLLKDKHGHLSKALLHELSRLIKEMAHEEETKVIKPAMCV